MSFNTFGKIFRFTTWGESHGPAIGCVVDGCPPNILLSEIDNLNISDQAYIVDIVPTIIKYFAPIARASLSAVNHPSHKSGSTATTRPIKPLTREVRIAPYHVIFLALEYLPAPKFMPTADVKTPPTPNASGININSKRLPRPYPARLSVP